MVDRHSRAYPIELISFNINATKAIFSPPQILSRICLLRIVTLPIVPLRSKNYTFLFDSPVFRVSNMMFSHLISFLALLGTAHIAVAAPMPDPSAEPEIELLRRQGLANVYSSCTVPNTVAITFDDGPYNYNWDLVDTLNNNGVKATFFVNGNNWRCIYDDDMVAALRHAYDSGHLIASHTWAHLNLAEQSWDKIHDEMWKVELALSRIIGVEPAWMRPPYGSYNDLVRSASAIRNQNLVIWDFDSGDSTGASADESKGNYWNIANSRPDTILTLNHETYASTVYDVIPYAISQLQSKGYNLVTVAECLGQPAYHSVFGRGEKDSSWVC
ncbi:glycoside hydrolase/deacetylase [Sanghuangporus baumii]|uniref:Glycoside hydrolase/deacetylase n=1 Tax=Sanghuangporus baumii TaxID=108892 RepID=A0A9Q5I4M2_SANBA|nr:glycoside hydrolase/deacetylase [Sanghuangporus baumii]